MILDPQHIIDIADELKKIRELIETIINEKYGYLRTSA